MFYASSFQLLILLLNIVVCASFAVDILCYKYYNYLISLFGEVLFEICIVLYFQNHSPSFCIRLFLYFSVLFSLHVIRDMMQLKFHFIYFSFYF